MAILELTTVDEVIMYPGIGDADENDRYWLNKLIRGFSVRAEKFTNRLFYTESRTRVFDGDLVGISIALEAYGDPTNTITSVKLASDRNFDETDPDDPSGYFFDWRTGLVCRPLGWELGRGNIQIIWTGGIGTTLAEVPYDLNIAATLQVAAWWQRRYELGLTQKQVNTSQITVFAPSKLLPEVEEILGSYKRVTDIG